MKQTGTGIPRLNGHRILMTVSQLWPENPLGAGFRALHVWEMLYCTTYSKGESDIQTYQWRKADLESISPWRAIYFHYSLTIAMTKKKEIICCNSTYLEFQNEDFWFGVYFLSHFKSSRGVCLFALFLFSCFALCLGDIRITRESPKQPLRNHILAC